MEMALQTNGQTWNALLEGSNKYKCTRKQEVGVFHLGEAEKHNSGDMNWPTGRTLGHICKTEG